MVTGTVFMNNRTQAIRVPKALAFPPQVKKVTITAVGDALVIRPRYETLEDWYAHREGADPGFMSDRDQGTPDERDWSQL